LPAFNGNTKPLKSRALDQTLVRWIKLFCLMRATERGAMVHTASVSPQDGNLGRSADGAFKGGVIALIELKYLATERPWARWPQTGLKQLA
jgi:hypothetical protein